MFVCQGKDVYEITRKSAMDGLKSAILKKLESRYTAKVLKSAVSEILHYVQFPKVMDSNGLYIWDWDNKKFIEYMLDHSAGILATGVQYEVNFFRPKYNGPEVKEIANILSYPLEQLLFDQKPHENAMIVQSDEKKYGVVSMSEDVKVIISKTLSEFLSKSESRKISDAIIKKINSDIILTACLRQNNDIVYYTLTTGSCKSEKLSIFDVSELYKEIMSSLPKLKAISKKAKKAAVYLHNYILYGYEISEYELKMPNGFRGNKAIFKRTEQGVDFYLHPKRGIWVSDYIKIRANQITLTFNQRYKFEQSEYYTGTYNGFPIFWDIDEDMPSDNIPIIRSGNMYKYYKREMFGMYAFDRKKGDIYSADTEQLNGKLHEYPTDDFEAYIRIYFLEGWCKNECKA